MTSKSTDALRENCASVTGGELGDGWVRDKGNFRYIPPKVTHPP